MASQEVLTEVPSDGLAIIRAQTQTLEQPQPGRDHSASSLRVRPSVIALQVS